MSREAWGDEGNVPENGRDTATYQELLSIRAKFGKSVKHRDIFRVPARVERRPEGWFIAITFPGAEVSLFYGEEKPLLAESPISLILEYTVPDEVV